MRQRVDAPDGLRWTVKRLMVPTGMRPLTGTGAEKVSQARQPHDGLPVVGTGSRRFHHK